MDVGERAALVEVPVTLESAIGSRDRAVDSDHGRLGFRGDDDGLDSTGPAWRGDARRAPQRDVGRRDRVSGLHGVEGLRPVQRFPRNAGRRPERQRADIAVFVGAGEHGQPGAGPVEALGLGDRDESEPALREPLRPDRPRLGVPLVRDGNVARVEFEDRRETGCDGALHPSA
jgi:hypothetical protein